jgi:hypothetical protein
MDTIYQILFPVIMTLWTLSLGWFIRLLSKVSRDLSLLDHRIGRLEAAQAVDDSEKKTIFNMLKRVEDKIDMILDPAFFKRCPTQHLHRERGEK